MLELSQINIDLFLDYLNKIIIYSISIVTVDQINWWWVKLLIVIRKVLIWKCPLFLCDVSVKIVSSMNFPMCLYYFWKSFQNILVLSIFNSEIELLRYYYFVYRAEWPCSADIIFLSGLHNVDGTRRWHAGLLGAEPEPRGTSFCYIRAASPAATGYWGKLQRKGL